MPNEPASSTSAPPPQAPPTGGSASPLEASVAHLASLLENLETTARPAQAEYKQKLVEVRLGLASALFMALRHKHAPTAEHSLRVALGSSSWGIATSMPPEAREALEVAALLHDIGKIGAPDCLLLKPGALEGDEARSMDRYRLSGLDILANCCPSPGIVEIIRHSAGWYDGSRPNYPRQGEDIPLGARMLAIVDAFDSMTTDQVYRPAMSRERAMHELFKHAGTQFDPELVKSFNALEITVPLHRKVVGNWLQALDPRRANRAWGQEPSASRTASASGPSLALFQQKLLDNMHDAVIFVDRNLRVLQWNRGAERLTGIAAASVLERTWSPALMRMREEDRHPDKPFACPAAYCIETGAQSLRRLLVADRNNRAVLVDVHTVPVVGPDGATHGAAIILHDASGEASLEERCLSLHERATKDPLTQVANRAEFDRTLEQFVGTHVDQSTACALIICDIDHFKSVNDTFGHPAGDDVLKHFGQLLKSECRTGDLVARYGGEEFVVLCAGCNAASAADRAEKLRRTMSETPQAALSGQPVTVSFGVTEVQAGDTPESMLRRADRALLEAKRLGRNMVVQLGSGWQEGRDCSEAVVPAGGGDVRVERRLSTAVPLNIAIEKLKGFVIDHHADVLAINSDKIELEMSADPQGRSRRQGDRNVQFLVDLTLSEQRVPTVSADGRAAGQISRTHVQVLIRLKRARDRRTSTVHLQANTILAAIKSYLMANDELDGLDNALLRPAGNMLAPWFNGRG